LISGVGTPRAVMTDARCGTGPNLITTGKRSSFSRSTTSELFSRALNISTEPNIFVYLCRASPDVSMYVATFLFRIRRIVVLTFTRGILHHAKCAKPLR